MTIGHHLLADLRDARDLADAARIEACLIAAAAAAVATLLGIRLRSFGPGQGVTGVALLAESPISIHTWREYCSAWVDIFMCGRAHYLHAGLEEIATGLGAEIAQVRVVERHFGDSQDACSAVRSGE